MRRRAFLKNGLWVLAAPAIVRAQVMPSARRIVPRPATAAGVSPPDFPDLLAWFKADSLALANNDPVTSWSDSSGNGHNASQGTGSAQPTFKTNQYSGQPCVTFDGTSDWMGLAAQIDITGDSGPGYGMIVVSKVTGNAFSPGVYYYFANNALNEGFSRQAASYNWFKSGNFGSGGAGYSALPMSALECAANLYSGSGSNSSWYNGTTLVSSTRPVVSGTTSYTRLSDGTLAVPFKGDLCEVVIYGASLSSTNYLDLYNNYLKPKWGLP